MTFAATILTLYPEMFPGPLALSLAGRAREEGKWSLDCVQIRDFAIDKHKTVDDTPAGGGAGMVLRVDVLAAAIDHARVGNPDAPVIAMTPRGKPLNQARVRELAREHAVCPYYLSQELARWADVVVGDYNHFFDIGVAVGTDKGLVVPVLRDADMLSFAGIEKTISEYGKRARDGQLQITDMQGGTFTISNGGVYGSLMSTPILNAPQSGILGMHKIQERPVVVGGKIEIRPMMYIALSYDHRIVDGKGAVTFLVAIASAVVLLALVVGDVVRRRRAWPEPIARPFECFPCRARFLTAQHLVWHSAQHRADFEHGEVEVLRGYRLTAALRGPEDS